MTTARQVLDCAMTEARPRSRSLGLRFWKKVDISTGQGCWIWTGCRHPLGYGRINLGGRGLGTTWAHRVSYELMVGPIPDGLVIDHLCRNPSCVNPWHLEPVTQAVNIMRGMSPQIVAHRNGTCQRGHDLATNAVRRLSNGRVVYCKACRRERRAARREVEANG